MDGTLIGNDSLVSETSAGIISDLSREGALITVATARTPATVEPLLKNTYTSIPAIVMTGAAMWDRTNRRYIDVRALPSDSVTALLDSFGRHGISPFVYTLSSGANITVFHTRSLSRQEENFYMERSGLRLKEFRFVNSLKPSEIGDSPILMLGIGPDENIMTLAGELRRTGRLSISAFHDIFNHDIAYIEVFGLGVSKASAVTRLKEMTDAESVTVYGDNLNDLTMFDIADEAVAVENAFPEVREKANRVIGSNSASSVALDIKEHYKAC